MCNGKHGTVGKLSADGVLEEIVGLQIHGCGGFIQDQYTGFPEQGPGETQQLPLTNTVGDPKTCKHQTLKHTSGI